MKHIFFEGPENIEHWATRNGHEFITANAFEYRFPGPEDYDVLVLMGGPMSVNDENILPWIKKEKKVIENAVTAGKRIIGVCLGAQLIARVAGAKVYKNPEKEIGWFPVEKIAPATSNGLLKGLPSVFPVFHWHGETFDLPGGAKHILKSDACGNQGFIYGNNILGLQFHMEGTAHSLLQMMENSRDEMIPGKFVQDEKTIRELTSLHIDTTEKYFNQLMDNFFEGN